MEGAIVGLSLKHGENQAQDGIYELEVSMQGVNRCAVRAGKRVRFAVDEACFHKEVKYGAIQKLRTTSKSHQTN